ncbi:cation:proton antiporter [Kitasatospora azatica]|uniref:cation:proton antiporter n=1 Tax=Kitasatospora azatica TaxID=58347 RepID=UPI00056579B4|nr:cation:proton antiporter [Kitasatospora azatica]
MRSLDTTTLLLAGLALLLGLSRAAGKLATRFGQPAVLAEIAVGVALGPTLLGRLLPGVHSRLFGHDVQTVLNGLAQLAVALYAFEIGRHLVTPADRAGARPLGRAPLVLAAVSLLAPGAAGVALAPALHARQLSGTGIGTGPFALFLACALGVTAVPVLARILQDRGLERTTVGRLSLLAASIGDGVCWCLLGLALWLAGRMGWVQLVAALLGAGAAGLVARRRARRPGSSTRVAGAVTTTGAICLAAAVSSGLGLHPLFGGLMLGLAWPGHRTPTAGQDAGSRVLDSAAGSSHGRPGSTATHPAISQLAAVLLPCFFLGAGQQVDLGADLTDGHFLLLVGLLLVVATVSKLVACALVGTRFGYPARDALRLGVLMNTRGLTEIVVLSTGYQAGLIGHRLFEALLVVALLATAAAGPALSLLAPRPVPAGREADGTARTSRTDEAATAAQPTSFS